MSFDNPYPFVLVCVGPKSYKVDLILHNDSKMRITYDLRSRKDDMSRRRRAKNIESWEISWYVTDPDHVPHHRDPMRGYRYTYEGLIHNNSMRIMSTLYHATEEFKNRVNPKHVHCSTLHDKSKESLSRIHHIILKRIFTDPDYTLTKKEKTDRTDFFIRRHRRS